MEQGEELHLPKDLQIRLHNTLVEDIDVRLKQLTTLVVLQENELTLVWFGIIGVFIYALVKEHNRVSL